jgi:hypothetical protein
VRCEVGTRRLASPEVLLELEELSRFLAARTECEVGGVLGPAEYLATTSFILARRDPSARSIPGDRFRVESLWRNYGVVRGERRLREIADLELERALVTVYLKDASFAGTQRLIDELRRYEAQHLAPLGIELRLAGDVAVSQALIAGIVGTEVRSVLGSILGVFLVTSLLGRSLLWGLWCVVPCLFAVLVNFAVMGWLGVPLGVATSMFSSIVLGIGVDYAIHLLEESRRVESLARALGAAGPAIAADAAAVALGFGVLLLSSVPATARLGGLLALSLGSALLATFVVLPALLGGEDRARAAPR